MNQPQDPKQQIAVEDVFPVVRETCTKLFDENLLLRGQVAGLQRQLAELATLVPAQEAPTPEPSYGGPDLAAQPPFPDDGRG